MKLKKENEGQMAEAGRELDRLSDGRHSRQLMAPGGQHG